MEAIVSWEFAVVIPHLFQVQHMAKASGAHNVPEECDLSDRKMEIYCIQILQRV